MKKRLDGYVTALRAIAREDGVVAAPLERLAEAFGVRSKRSAQRIVGELVAARRLERVSVGCGRSHTSVYRLVERVTETVSERTTERTTKGDTEGGRGEARPTLLSSPEEGKESFPSSRVTKTSALASAPAETTTKGDTERTTERTTRFSFADEAIADRLLGVLELLADLLAERVRSKLDGSVSNAPNVNSVSAVAAAPAPAGSTATSSPRTSSSGETRPPTKPRAAAPLWGCETAERTEALDRARKILAAELRAGESVGSKLEDVRRYPLEDVLRAVAHVELAVARGKPLRSRAASFWSALTDPTYKLEEGALANRDAVDEALERERAQVVVPQPRHVAGSPEPPAEFFEEARRELLANGVTKEPSRAILLATARALQAKAQGAISA